MGHSPSRALPPGSARPGRQHGRRLLRSAVVLARSCHPEACAAVTLVAVMLAGALGRPAAGMAAVGAAVLAGHLSVGWHNDWLDADRDLAAGRTDKPVAAGLVRRQAVGRGAAAAALLTVPLSLLSGGKAGLAHIAAVALAWGYNASLKSTAWSWAPYAVSFPLLVAFIYLGLPGAPWPPLWAVTATALLATGAHLANALPDLEDDQAGGVRGLPHRLGRNASRLGAGVLLLGASVIVTIGSGPPGAGTLSGLGVVVVLIAAAAVQGRHGGGRWAFRLTLAVAVADVAMLVARTGSLRS